jgi:hypothetical protein
MPKNAAEVVAPDLPLPPTPSPPPPVPIEGKIASQPASSVQRAETGQVNSSTVAPGFVARMGYVIENQNKSRSTERALSPDFSNATEAAFMGEVTSIPPPASVNVSWPADVAVGSGPIVLHPGGRSATFVVKTGVERAGPIVTEAAQETQETTQEETVDSLSDGEANGAAAVLAVNQPSEHMQPASSAAPSRGTEHHWPDTLSPASDPVERRHVSIQACHLVENVFLIYF